MTRQNDQYAFPGWFKNVLWLIGFVIGGVVYHNTTYNALAKDMAVIQTEHRALREEFNEYKKKTSEDLREILKNTNDIVHIVKEKDDK